MCLGYKRPVCSADDIPPSRVAIVEM